MTEISLLGELFLNYNPLSVRAIWCIGISVYCVRCHREMQVKPCVTFLAGNQIFFILQLLWGTVKPCYDKCQVRGAAVRHAGSRMFCPRRVASTCQSSVWTALCLFLGRVLRLYHSPNSQKGRGCCRKRREKIGILSSMIDMPLCPREFLFREILRWL